MGDFSKELAAERSKAAAVEGKLKEQLFTREREITAVQARMQASYQNHVSETQQLQGKVSPVLCSPASSSGCWMGFGGRCMVFWRRLRCARGLEPWGGARSHDVPGPWCSTKKRHLGASLWDIASLHTHLVLPDPSFSSGGPHR